MKTIIQAQQEAVDSILAAREQGRKAHDCMSLVGYQRHGQAGNVNGNIHLILHLQAIEPQPIAPKS